MQKFIDKEFTWRQLPGYRGSYWISKKGEIYSVRSKKMLSPYLRKGYETVELSLEGVKEKLCIHRKVAEIFVPNPQNKNIVNHLDGDKRNNYYLNLEWCTVSENTQHAYDNSLIDLPKGKDRYNSKLNEEDILWIRKHFVRRCKVFGATAIGRMFGVDCTTIRDIVEYKSWKHIK